ncbi:MAG: dienelactone hydrolase family protein [Gemmataceae bacterium]|nr:dienelactone hydrolase family protein [Gemmataceae bacterium]
MAGKTIDIVATDGGRFTGYLALPEKGAGPGIVLIQEIFGVNAALRHTADLYAEEGYVVLAPDLFWRMQPNVDLAFDPESRKKAMDFNSRFDSDLGVIDIGASLTTLRARPECTGKVAVIGFCLGGRLAYLTAARLKVDAAIGFYGVNIDQHLGEAGKIACPLLLHFGSMDPLNPPDKVEKIRSAFTARPEVGIHVYTGADHGFYMPERASYHRPSAWMAHSRTIALLRGVMGPHYDLNALWEKHCEYEFATRDADATMKTMVPEPYVNHIPVMTGGVGHEQLHRFYKHHFIPTLPKDTRLVSISRTIGADRVVDELLFCFTHDREIDWLLPGIPPTGKYVEIPTVAIVCFRGDKLYHEHIYWDQATVLAQIGLLDPKTLPIAGNETARKVLDEKQPSNTLMKRWAESEGKR